MTLQPPNTHADLSHVLSTIWRQLGLRQDVCYLSLGAMRHTPGLHQSFQDFVAQHDDWPDDTIVVLGPTGIRIDEVN